MRGRTEAAVEVRAEVEVGGATREGATYSRVHAPARRLLPHLRLLRSSRADPPQAEGSRRDAATSTDGELVTLALNGGAAAFAHLMRRHARHLHAVIARRLRDPEDVRDAVQDTQLAVWRALRHYDAGRPFEAWITTIAINKCRDAVRRRATQAGMLSRLRSERVHAGWSALEERGIERQLIGKESMRCLGKALDELPPQLRLPLMLTTVRERSQEAAARELGLTRKAVEMRVRRAREHLARALEAVYA